MRAPRTAGLLVATALLAAPPAHAEPDAPLVAIDIGHTLAAPGATSARGRTEFEFNRELAQHIIDALEARGLKTLLINADGQIESLQARPQRAANAQFLLSIHHDSVSELHLTPWEWQGQTQSYSDEWAGHSMFVSRRNPDMALSLTCASAIGARLQRAGFAPTDKNGRRREYADVAHATHYYDELVVLYQAHQAALLFEAGVIKHRAEEMLLRDPLRQRRMADEIATGIAACLLTGEGETDR